ncbi:hypothetical protein [Desulfoluna sp.]|uniref:hypothetical protein n=1 Tax=Desulfoluna sp. TaxID=2045199 RepID=UPI002621BF29|nr:hypothetical protein [Desulfoluna sp.]
MTASQPVREKNLPAQSAPSTTRVIKTTEVKKKQLINALNHINFKEETVTLVFHGASPEGSVSLEATPMPVLSDYPAFRFLHPPAPSLNFDGLTGLIIPDGTGQIHAIPTLHAATQKGLSIALPETGQRLQGAPSDARTAEGIRVHFHQQGLVFKGALTALEPGFFQVSLTPLSSHYLMGLTPERDFTLLFLKNKANLFESGARLIEQERIGDSITLTFQPVESIATHHDNERFGKKAFEMIPAPDFQFSHPLTRSLQTLAIDSLSAVGLEFTLHGESLPLLPGMRLDPAAISLGDLYTLPLTAQVTRCQTTLDTKGLPQTRCTVYFLDIELETHRKLQTMIHKAEDRNVRLSTPVDADDLWRFFFETGFIYKSKYRLFLNNKENIKQTYHALYSAPTEITRHMTYQDKGRTLGHMSIVRYAERAWLIHHHAALKAGGIKVGLGILSHMLHFFYDTFWHHPMGMDYLICYFRPENQFPNFFFNGFREHMANPKACSTDLFAYLYFRGEPKKAMNLPSGWSLSPATEEDVDTFASHYEATSGGMLVDALDLFEHHAPAEHLAARFRDAGLKKERELWAIRHNHRHVALLIVNTSDVALNMSDLTNCIKVCITEPELLPKEVLTMALNRLSDAFHNAKAPVLIHPLTWAEETDFHFQKQYYFWVFNADHRDDYMQYFFDVLKLTRPQAS